MKSIEKATTFWSRPDHKLVEKFALWRLDVRCLPCLWRAVTDDLVKSRSEHAAVRLTTQCVHSVAQMLQNQGSKRVRARFGVRARSCVSRCAPGVSRHAPPASVATPPAKTVVKLRTFNLSVATRMGTPLWKHCKSIEKALKSIEKAMKSIEKQ